MQFWRKVFPAKKETLGYAGFWKWFQKHEKAFFQIVESGENLEKGFFDPLSAQLDKVKKDIFYLTGMAKDDLAELILTPDGSIKDIVFVEELVAAAPKIKGWLFTALKPATSIKEFSIQTEGYQFDTDNIHFYANIYSDFPDEIDITLVHNDLTESNKEIIINGTYLFLDNYLGELYSVTTIDSLEVIGPYEAKNELISVEKLSSYLTWREKEFIEKYEDTWWASPPDDTHHYALFEGKKNDEVEWLALMKLDVLEWEGKASHPWMLEIKIEYNGKHFNGFPEGPTYQLLDEMEDQLQLELPGHEGYIHLGRETGLNLRTIYFACKDFRKPAKVLFFFQQRHAKLSIHFEFYKDKYWQRLRRFQQY